VCDTNFVLDYFRTTDDHRMLYGGPRQLQHGHAGQPGREHAPAHGRHLPAAGGTKVEYAWGGFVDISMNRAPDFGRMPAGAAANVYYLQGFSGHGLALTGLAGRLVAEAMPATRRASTSSRG
jgi:gamma-glutamylputrescine oxidase